MHSIVLIFRHSIVLIFMSNSNRWSSHAWRIVVYGLKVHVIVVTNYFKKKIYMEIG